MLGCLCVVALISAAIPLLLTLRNLPEYRPPPPVPPGAPVPALAVIIPARNEESGIAACLEGVLASRGLDLQVFVVDDSSTDRTAAVVLRMGSRDARLQLLQAAALPAGWNGKQHACWVGAEAAMAPLLCFLDADVRLQPDALTRTVGQVLQTRAALLSGFPQELTGTWLEKLLIPLIHFVLLGLLPMRMMHTTTLPGAAAGCGQFLLVTRESYFAAGGHKAIRETMHDGLRLPRLLREHGYRTCLVDLTHLASCRMYHSAAETWKGLAKNATEGMAAPRRIVPMTLLLGLGQVLPLLLLYAAWQQTVLIVPFLGPAFRTGMVWVWVALGAVVFSYGPRAINAARYRQSWLGVLLHPVSVAALLLLQWTALLRKLSHRPATWKNRAYQAN